jgi:phytoene dehydrogenase-like protein
MTRPDRFRRLEREEYDAIVVGAGIGGLTAAGLLARRGLSVLVVDRHYVAGGNATVFKRPGYEFDVGIHYLGQAYPGGALSRILEGAGARGVRFRPMDPDGFDTLVYPDLELKVPGNLELYRERLLAAFPGERRAIDANHALISQVNGLMSLATKPKAALGVLFGSFLALRNATSTLGQFLARYTRNEKLAAVIAGEGGDYALPPSQASALMHAGLMGHYLDRGAYYPEGGGQIMSDRLAESIEQSGGKILLSTHVERILVEDRKVRGVVLSNKHLGRVQVHAKIVVANSDIKQTLLELLQPGAVRRSTRERARNWKMAPALAALYLGVKAGALGSRTANTNYWIYDGYDIEGQYAEVEAGNFPRRPLLFVSIASLKDPHNRRIAPPGRVNLQLMSLAPSDPAAWGVTAEEIASGEYRESPRYQACKAEYSERLLRAANPVFPDLARHVELQELATPITHSRYTLSTGGTSYGIAASPDQFLWRRPGASTEIGGLYLCGASTRTGHGIMGAMMGGLMAAGAIVGNQLMRDVLSGALTAPREAENAPLDRSDPAPLPASMP